MKENVSGCFFSEHSVQQIVKTSTSCCGKCSYSHEKSRSHADFFLRVIRQKFVKHTRILLLGHFHERFKGYYELFTVYYGLLRCIYGKYYTICYRDYRAKHVSVSNVGALQSQTLRKSENNFTHY